MFDGHKLFWRALIQQNVTYQKQLRNKMTDARLSALEMLSLELDLLSEVSFETIIEQFATVKSRTKL